MVGGSATSQLLNENSLHLLMSIVAGCLAAFTFRRAQRQFVVSTTLATGTQSRALSGTGAKNDNNQQDQGGAPGFMSRLDSLREALKGSSSTASSGSGKAVNVVVEALNDIECELDPEILKFHQSACDKKEAWYTDPKSGLMVATRFGHMERGRCCGNRCRHCPFAHVNVPESVKQRVAMRKRAKAECNLTPSSNPTTPKSESLHPPTESNTIPTTGAATAHKASVYTKTGDGGTSALFTGERRSKADPVFEALGTIDELNSFTGLAREWTRLQLVNANDSSTSASSANKGAQTAVFDSLETIQRYLLNVGSIVATPDPTAPVLVNYDPAQWTVDLEALIDRLDSTLPPLTEFILPGGSLAAAQLHVCRSVCRRAERILIELRESQASRAASGATQAKYNETLLHAATRYVNRLSDYFFVAARVMAVEGDRRRHSK
jgi:cob(I)alamin adenosyltransferase